jgi:hypothetical protein
VILDRFPGEQAAVVQVLRGGGDLVGRPVLRAKRQIEARARHVGRERDRRLVEHRLPDLFVALGVDHRFTPHGSSIGE